MTDAPIVLPPRMRRSEVQSLYQVMSERPPDAAITLDASDVQEMSAVAVSLILSAHSGRPGPLRIAGAGDVFTDAFSDLGCFSDMMKLEFTL